MNKSLYIFTSVLMAITSHAVYGEIRAIRQADGTMLLTNVKKKTPRNKCAMGCVYVYKTNNTGVEHWTNRKASKYELNTKNIALIRTIPIRGRPQATASCYKVNNKKFTQRIKQYETLIATHARTYNVDPALVKAVIHAESCFDKKAVSRVGARGLMQLMPGTASDLGVNDSFDPNQNIRGGTRYLSQMQKKFNNDFKLTLAAYNAGPLNVMKYNGVPPFKETKNYIKKVRAYYQKYSQ